MVSICLLGDSMLVDWSKKLRSFELSEDAVKELERVDSLCFNRDSCAYSFDDFMNLVVMCGCSRLEYEHDLRQFLLDNGVHIEGDD